MENDMGYVSWTISQAVNGLSIEMKNACQV